MEEPWEHHTFSEAPWDQHGNIMKAHTPYGSAMKAPWKYHESTIEALCFRWNTMEYPWKRRGDPRKHHGSTMGVNKNPAIVPTYSSSPSGGYHHLQQLMARLVPTRKCGLAGQTRFFLRTDGGRDVWISE